MWNAEAQSWECETCDRLFRSLNAVNMHMNALAHWAPTFKCETCPKKFSTQHAAEQHMRTLDHWNYPYECDWCNLRFRFESDFGPHTSKCEFRPRFDCDACPYVFDNEEDVRDHMDEFEHWRRGHYCRPCDRQFQNENNLKQLRLTCNQHLKSTVHQGKTIFCPFCGAGFTTASGVAHHLETSACPNARHLSRMDIYEALRERDPQGLITRRLLTYPDFGSADAEMIATSATWNGYAYECYLCHKVFNRLRSLDQHLASPVHQQKLYCCPNNSCHKEFLNLAGLFNHLESESCHFMRFEKVGKLVKTFMDGRSGRLIEFGA